MRVLIFTWKDLQHPAAGGAEVVTFEVAKCLVNLGHRVTLFTSRPEKTVERETTDGVKIIRAGGRYSVYIWAVFYYFKFFRSNFDVVVDQVNTVPFFTPLFVVEKKVALFHQLAREIWFYETRFPISLIGFFMEPVCLLLYRNVVCITGSESSRNDLRRFGVKKVRMIDYAVSAHRYSDVPEEKPVSSIIFVGRLVPSKRVVDVIKAFKIVKGQVSNLKLYIIGRGTEAYEKVLRKLVSDLNLVSEVAFTGFVSKERRTELLSVSSLIAVTSVKEGWGLIVTEAQACGTPAVVYDVDGLRDSVKDGVTGLVCQRNTPANLAENIVKLLLDRSLLRQLSVNSWRTSQDYTFNRTSRQFLGILDDVVQSA